MSVDTTTRKQTFNMDGSTVNFDFTFRALRGNEEDIKCLIISTTGTITLLTYSTEYSVVIDRDGGGTVTVSDPETTGTTLLVYRDTTNTQESDYEDFNQFPADTVENDFDKRTMRSQEIDDDISRAVKANISSSLSDIELPTPSAGKALVWDTGLTGITNSLYDPDEQVNEAAAYATSASNSAISAASSALAAATSATEALASQVAAATSATEALASEHAAGTYATNALNSQYAAGTSATAALASESAAGTYATNALASEHAAGTYATNALNSQNIATTQASIATTQATIASSHATTALGAKDDASSHATTALNAQTAASSHATTASGYATDAGSHATTALNAAAKIPAATDGTIGQNIRVDATNNAYEHYTPGTFGTLAVTTSATIANATISTLTVNGIQKVIMPDNTAEAFGIGEGANPYMCIDTVNGSEAVKFGCLGASEVLKIQPTVITLSRATSVGTIAITTRATIALADITSATIGTLNITTKSTIAQSDTALATIGTLNLTTHSTIASANITTATASTLQIGDYKMPTSDGTVNQIMKTNGTGTLTFQDEAPTGSGITMGKAIAAAIVFG